MKANTETLAPRTIRGRVDDTAILRVTRFYDAKLFSIFGELFQNARRAGASRINVEVSDTEIVVSDNGRGIETPQVLVDFGRSDYPGREHEEPAGMGLYSLAQRQTEINSRPRNGKAWTVSMTPDVFSGKAEAQVRLSDSPPHHGTVVRFERKKKEWPESDARVAGLYLPIAVTINGKAIEQQSFLERPNNRWMRHDDDLSIVVSKDASPVPGRMLEINFFGHIVRDDVGAPQIDTIDAQWYASVDITKCPELALVLPERKCVVRNAFLEKLKERLERTVLEGIAAQEPPVPVPYRVFKDAATQGIPLRIPAPTLRPWRAQPAARNGSALQIEHTKAQPLGEEPIVIDAKLPAPAQALLEFATTGNDTLASDRLFDAEEKYTGFAWYDQLPRLTRIHVEAVENGKATRLENSKCQPSRRVDKLWTCATVRNTDGTEKVYRVETKAALGYVDRPTEPATSGILFANDFSGWPDDVEEMAEKGLYIADMYSDESESTQLRNFRQQLRHEIEVALGGREKATAITIREAIRRTQANLPKDRDTVIRIHAAGPVDVTFETPMRTNAGPQN